ncbi:MAG: hypothetical protein AB8H03_03305, partial [Saprospiraceae bacterium]
MKRFSPLDLNFMKMPISMGSLLMLLFFLNPWSATAQTNNLPLAVSYPMIDDLLDATGNFTPIFLSDPMITSVGEPVCLVADPIEYARTPFLNDLDWTNFGYSIDVNISAYPISTSASFNRGGPIAITSTSFRNSAIWIGEGGELGILYNNQFREYSTTILNLDQWYNIEFYFESETAYLYLDGVLVFTFNTGPIQTSVIIGSNTINADKTLSTRNFGGGGTEYDRCVRNMKVYFEPSCVASITCPNPGTFECGDNSGINAWLASATAETCNLPGTTVSNNYDPANFSGCNSTENITFSLTNSAGQVIADCVTSLTIDDNTAPSIVCPPNVTIECGDPTGVGGSSGLLITEADPNSPDFIEIQNMINSQQDYTGWFVAISDSYSNINVVNPITWELGVMGGNGIMYRSDNTGLNYWGNNMFWNSTASSWAILVDNNGNVADAVFWGWDAAAIASFNTTINGFNITIPETVWSGDGIAGACAGADSRNRQGTADNNNASDWFCSTSTVGVANPGLNISGGGGSSGGGNGTATASDTCDPEPTVSFTDSFVAGDCPQSGVIIRTWTATDACGNMSTSCQQTITINPPAAPTVTAPIFPTSVSCSEVSTLVIANATYTNGVDGDCELKGELAASVVNNFDICGGTIMVSYNGVDACNNVLTAGPFTIDVDPAPAPTISTSAYSSPITCANAENYVPPMVTFTNGLSGACSVSGNAIATVTNVWNSCGGIILINYSGTTSCGQEISIPSITIEVQAAPLPVIVLPTLPTSLSCDVAGSFIAPTGTTSNAATGDCNISGTVSADVNYLFDECGGILQIIYSGEDECGRNLVAVVETIDVDPAPAPTIQIPNFPTSMSCSEAENFVAPITSYDNGLTGDCKHYGLIESEVTLMVDACSGGTV